MQSTSNVGIGLLELLLLLLGGGGMGMPPGERDVTLLKAAPQQSLVYVEWASRGAGKEGAPGIDGFAADPEIRAFVRALETALQSTGHSGDEETQPWHESQEAMHLAQLISAHSGCLFAVIDPAQPGKGLLNVPTPAEVIARLHACVILNAGADTAAIIESINKSTHNEIPPSPRMHAATGPAGMTLTVHQDGDRLLIGMGAGTIERAMADLKNGSGGLEKNARFAAGMKRVAVDRQGAMAWVDLKGVSEAVISSMGPAGLVVQAVLRGAGADGLDSLTSTIGAIDGIVIQRTFLATDGRQDGILMIAQAAPLRMEQLSHIPADSDFVLATSLDFGQMFGGVRDLISKTNPLSLRVFDEATKELETELGLNLTTDVFPAFGTGWTAFSSPSEGGLVGSSMIVSVEVRDPARAQAVFDRLMQLLEQSLTTGDAEFSTSELKRQEFLGKSISYISRTGIGYGVTPSVIPSFCLTDTHLLFSVHPQAIKAHLRQQKLGRPGFNKVAASKVSLPREELLSAFYLDGPRATQVLSGLLPFVSQSVMEVAREQGFDFDPFFIPSAVALIPYSSDVTMSIARQKDGLMMECRNPQLGLALLTALSWARHYLHADYEVLLEARHQRLQPVLNAGLGAPEGQVVPAAAAAPAPKEKPANPVNRHIAPVLIRALVPDGVQSFIPEDVIRRLSEPPSPEVQKQREDRRKALEERRRARLERRGLPLPPVPQKD